MNEISGLLTSIASSIKTYRTGELPEPNAQHVEKWVSQFTPENKLPFLREFDHLIKNSFITEAYMSSFLANLIQNQGLAGANPKEYWLKVNILTIQKDGQSQRAMVKLFEQQLQKIYGINLSQCGSEGGDFIYLDDVIFSGGRIGTDLTAWIKESAPQEAAIQVIVIAWHTLGQYHLSNNVTKAAIEVRKKIKVTYWRAAVIENRRTYKDASEVLWPVAIPETKEVHDYIALPHRYPFQPRIPGIARSPFSSEEGRQILEREFFVAGAKIRSQGNFAEVNRPLGHGFYGIGFGATVATYRNCPNNCPLAMWWGDPNESSGALKWYPLLQRKNYSSAENVFAKLFN